jgi:hypothetical protein
VFHTAKDDLATCKRCFAARFEVPCFLDDRGSRGGHEARNGVWIMPSPDPTSDKRASIVAKSLHRELREGGFTSEELVRLATELLGLVTLELRARRTDVPR